MTPSGISLHLLSLVELNLSANCVGQYTVFTLEYDSDTLVNCKQQEQRIMNFLVITTIYRKSSFLGNLQVHPFYFCCFVLKILSKPKKVEADTTTIFTDGADRRAEKCNFTLKDPNSQYFTNIR